MSILKPIADMNTERTDAREPEEAGAPRMTVQQALQARLEWERLVDKWQMRRAVGARV